MEAGMMLSPESEQYLKNKYSSKVGTAFDYLGSVSQLKRDQMSSALSVATHTGSSIDSVYDSKQFSYDNIISPEEFVKIGVTHPQVKAFLDDPVHMAIVRDQKNIDSLIALQDNSSYTTAAINGVKAIPRTIAAAFEGLNKSGEAAVKTMTNVWGNEYADRFGGRGREIFTNLVNAASFAQTDANLFAQIDWEAIRTSEYLKPQANEAPADRWGKQLLLDVIENAPQVLAQAAITFASGGVAGGAFMGAQIAGGSYETLVDEGVAPERAFIGGLVNSILQAPLEQLPMSRILKPLNRSDKFVNTRLRKLGLSMISEGLTEAIQQFPEEATEIWAKNKDLTPDQQAQMFVEDFDGFLKRAGYAGLIGAIFGGVLGVGNIALARETHGMKMQQLDETTDRVRGMPLTKQSPEVTKNFLNKDGDMVYIDAEQLLNVHNQTQGGVIEDLGLSVETVEDAVDSGDMVEVPYGNYVVPIAEKRPEIHEALKSGIAFDENGITNNRIEILNDSAVKKAKEDAFKQEQEVQVEEEKIINEIRQTGKATAAQAQDATTVLSSIARTMSANPAKWLQETAPRFMNEDMLKKVKLAGKNIYNQAAMYRNSAESISEFRDFVLENQKNPQQKDKSFFRYATQSGVDVDVSFNTIEHIEERHSLSGEQLQAIMDNLENIEYAGRNDEKSRNSGIPVLLKINTPAGKAGVVLDFMKNGRVLLNTAFFDTDVNIDNWAKNKKGSYALGNPSSENSLTISPQEGVSRLSHHLQGSSPINIIKQELGIVNDIYGQDGEVNKGFIGWTDEGRAVIVFREGADASTVIHEMLGHYASQYVIDMGARENAPDVLKKDRKTLLEYAGIENWESATPEQRRAAHEKWAEAAETYILEGHAPSIELKKVFARFKEWLREVYKKIQRSENMIPLTDEVRGVFDRMLATEQQIAEKQYAEGYYNKLPQSVVEKLSPAQQQRLDKLIVNARQMAEDIVAGKILKVYTKEAKQQIREERPKVYQETLERLSNEPIYKTISNVKSQFPTKNVWQLAGEYQAKEAAELGGQEYKGSLSEEEALNFDILAQSEGYSSGSELASAISETPTLEKAAYSATNDYIKSKYDEVYQNKNVFEQQAREAMYNDGGADIVATELQIIEELSGRLAKSAERAKYTLLLKNQTRQIAKDNISQMSIDRATRPQNFITAERKAAERAAVAMAKGDMETALEQKRIQLYNHSMVQESLRVKRRYESARNYFGRQRKAKRATFFKEEHFVQAADILARAGFARRDYMPVMKTQSLSDYVKWQESAEGNPDMIEIDSVDIESVLSLGNLRQNANIDQYESLVNAVKNIKQIAKAGVDSDLLSDGKSLSKEVEAMFESSSKVKSSQVDKAGTPKMPSGLDKYIAGNKKVDLLLSYLDNAQEFGPWFKSIYLRLANGSSASEKLNSQVETKYRQAYKDLGISKTQQRINLTKKVYMPEWDVSLTKEEMIELTLNLGSKSNLERMTGTVPIGFNQDIDWKVDNWNLESIKAVLANYMTMQDYALVDKVWQTINVYPEYNEMHKKMTGFSMEKVEAVPIELYTSDGQTYISDGGYYPLTQDYRASLQAEQNLERTNTENFAMRPVTNSGGSKARTNARYPVSLDPANRANKIQQHIHDISFRPIMHDINKIMAQPEIRAEARRVLGDAGYAQLKDAFFAVAANRLTPLSGGSFIDPVLNFFRSSVVIAKLALKPSVILQNPANQALYAGAVEGYGIKDSAQAFLRHGTGDFIPAMAFNRTRMNEILAEVFSQSSMMKSKFEFPDFTFRELAQNQNDSIATLLPEAVNDYVTGMTPDAAKEVFLRAGVGIENMRTFATRLMAWSDMISDVPNWLGARDKFLGQGYSLEESIQRADMVIARSTGTGRLIDTSGMQRGSAASRTFTMFTGFFNTWINQIMRESNIALTQKQYWRALDIVGRRIIAFGAVSAFLAGKLPEEDEWLEWFLQEIGFMPLAALPVLGDAVQIAVEGALGIKAYSFQISPITGVYTSGQRAIGAARKYVQGEEEIESAAELLADFMSYVLRYPDQINDWFFNIYDLAVNDMEFEISDFYRRRPRKER